MKKTRILSAVILYSIIFLTSCTVGNFQKEPEKDGEVDLPQSTQISEPEKKADEAKKFDYYSVDNSASGWGFKKNIGEKPDISDETIMKLSEYDTYCMGNEESKVLFLTFDEGYENGYTAQILDTLKKCEVPAAFFITGAYFDREQELIRRMNDEGHIIGNHTEHHPNLPKLENAEKMLDEFQTLNEKFYAAFSKNMKYMRPPEGEYSDRVLKAAQNAGYKTILWSFAYRDWERNSIKGKQYAIDQVTPYLHNGAILLLHAVSKDNADALEDIIRYARSQGFEFKSLDSLPKPKKINTASDITVKTIFK